MRIAFVTTVKDRVAHLSRTLPQNLADNPRSIFVVLDYGSNEDVSTVTDPLRSDRLKVYRHEAPRFRMSHAKNMAHRLGLLEGADILVNVDADNFLHVGFEDFIEKTMQSRPERFLWAGSVKGQGKKLRGVSGRIAVTREAFLKTGGYDETQFDCWGHDDTNLNRRLQMLGYQPAEIARCYLECIPHGDGLRFREYPHAQPADLGADVYDRPPKPARAIANFGNVGCGVVRRQDGQVIALKPIPTRIFGIGMHKTATTSLHAALQILGYESAHWTSGAWARKVWDEMRTFGVSATLERSYAASDLPISVLYRELDEAYPESKFILTMRDEVDWLRSVRDHWTDKNPHRWEWDVYPFSNRIHKAIYGRTDFDAPTFLARYRRHNAEVLEYFKDRPDDLLVMREQGWPKLCEFLDQPVPQFNYPKQFVTADHQPKAAPYWYRNGI